jgi:hypothetical protein
MDRYEFLTHPFPTCMKLRANLTMFSAYKGHIDLKLSLYNPEEALKGLGV